MELFWNKDGTDSESAKYRRVRRQISARSIFGDTRHVFSRRQKGKRKPETCLATLQSMRVPTSKILCATTFGNATKTADANMNFVFQFQFQPGIFMKQELSIGDRVRISVLGASRYPRLASKSGTIVGGSVYASSVSVRFDGNKSASTFHRDYVEAIASADSGE